MLESKKVGAVRILLGIYLLTLYLRLIPYATELFSNAGALPDSKQNFTDNIFPGIFNFFDSQLFVIFFFSVLIIVSIFFIIGFFRRTSAFVLWFGWASLLSRNILSEDPSTHFIGWLLLAYAIIPSGEYFSLQKKKDWEQNKLIPVGAWIIFGAAYSASGLAKLLSPSWADGSALYYILHVSLTNSLGTLMLSAGPVILTIITWIVLGTQILALPLSLIKSTKLTIWLLIALQHVATLLFIGIADVSIAMLLFQLLLIEPEWMKKGSKKSSKKT